MADNLQQPFERLYVLCYEGSFEPRHHTPFRYFDAGYITNDELLKIGRGDAPVEAGGSYPMGEELVCSSEQAQFVVPRYKIMVTRNAASVMTPYRSEIAKALRTLHSAACLVVGSMISVFHIAVHWHAQVSRNSFQTLMLSHLTAGSSESYGRDCGEYALAFDLCGRLSFPVRMIFQRSVKGPDFLYMASVARHGLGEFLPSAYAEGQPYCADEVVKRLEALASSDLSFSEKYFQEVLSMLAFNTALTQ